ncbi:unnamed protein product [Amoebophrya sp. A25]|nr:unnamed protein product [Amoebophrya sp. A25]|eukprot:GSA25T00027570001.1
MVHANLFSVAFENNISTWKRGLPPIGKRKRILHCPIRGSASEENFLKVGDKVRNIKEVHFGGRKVPVGSLAVVDKFGRQLEYPYTIRTVETGQRGRILASEVELLQGPPQDEFIATLRKQEYFGEQVIAKNCLRTATLRVPESCPDGGLSVLVIHRDKLKQFGRGEKLQFVRRKAMRAAYRKSGQSDGEERVEKTKEQIDLSKRAIRGNPNLTQFVQMNEDQLDSLARSALLKRGKPGEQIIKEGVMFADRFYVIQSGSFCLEKNEKRVGSSAGPECSFGELALLYHVPTAASVFCEETAGQRADSSSAASAATAPTERGGENTAVAVASSSEQTDSSSSAVAGPTAAASNTSSTSNQNQDVQALESTAREQQGGGRLWVISRSAFKRELVGGNDEKVNEYVEFISSIETFHCLLSSEKQRMAESLVELTFENGKAITREGDKGEFFYILKQGCLRIIQSELPPESVQDGLPLPSAVLENAANAASSGSAAAGGDGAVAGNTDGASATNGASTAQAAQTTAASSTPASAGEAAAPPAASATPE